MDSRRNTPPVRLDPSTGLPLPPSEAERALNRWWAADDPRNSSSRIDSTDDEEPDEDASAVSDSGGSIIPDTTTGGTTTTLGPVRPPVSAAVPPFIVSPPMPPPTRPNSSQTTSTPQNSAAPSTPNTTSPSSTREPFRCTVRASLTGTQDLPRLLITVSGTNRDEAWSTLRWPSTTIDVRVTIRSGVGQAMIEPPLTTLPSVQVFESANRQASELGCSFAP